MMTKKKKKQSGSQSSTEKNPKKTLEPKLLSISHSKLASGKDMKHTFRGMSSKPSPGLSSQSRVVRCPKCHKFLQEPVDVTIYKCSECDSILQGKHREVENNDNSIHPEDLFSSQNRSLTPVRSSYQKYSSRASPCFETTYRRHETSYIPREWIRKADEFSVTGDAFASARSCSGVVKLSITKKEDNTLLDKGSEEDTRRSRSSGSIDLKLEAFQPQLKHKKLREQKPEETSRILHLQQSVEDSAEGGGGGSKTPVRSSYRKYNSRGSPLFERGGYHSETAYRRHESSYIHREWMRMADELSSVTGDSSEFASARSSPYNSRSNATEWTQHKRKPPQVPFYSLSPSPSSVYDYGHSSPYSQSQMHDSQYHNLYESSSCSGVLKSSITKKEETTLLDLFRFVDSRTSFADETVIHSHLSSSDKGSGDRICISTDAFNLETSKNKGGEEKEDIRTISSKFYDLKLEAFQPRWKPVSSETIGEASRTHLEQSEEALNKNEHERETNVLSENTRDTQEFDLGELKWEDFMGDKPVLEKSQYTGDSISDSSSSNGEIYEDTDRAGLHLEEYETNYENYSSNPFEWTSVGVPTFHMPEYDEPEEEAQGRSSESSSSGSLNNHESSEESAIIWEFQEAKPDQSQYDYEISSERQEWGNNVFNIVRSELEEYRYQTIERTWTEIRGDGAPIFRLPEQELGTMPEPDEDAHGKSESSSRGGSLNDHVISKEREMDDHEEESWPVVDENDPWLVDDYETKAFKVEDEPSLNLEKSENEEKMLLDQTVEPREDIFRLSLDDTLEQERVTFHLDMSHQEKQVNLLRQTFIKQGDTEESIQASGSMVSSEGHEHLEYLKKENEKSGLTSEIVGLRHALYQTQTSPLSCSPIHTHIGSPLMRSPIDSPMRSHIVSPLRSPINNTSGSLSQVLFFGKKT